MPWDVLHIKCWSRNSYLTLAKCRKWQLGSNPFGCVLSFSAPESSHSPLRHWNTSSPPMVQLKGSWASVLGGCRHGCRISAFISRQSIRCPAFINISGCGCVHRSDCRGTARLPVLWIYCASRHSFLYTSDAKYWNCALNSSPHRHCWQSVITSLARYYRQTFS